MKRDRQSQLKLIEEWRDIPGYENNYQASSLGNIRSLQRTIKTRNGFRNYKSTVYKQYISTNGYCYVHLGHSPRFTVHRLVAMTFIPNPEGKKTINHINGVRTDNRVENLEWATHSENGLHSYRVLGRVQLTGFKPGNLPLNSRKITRLNPSGELIETYQSIAEAAKILGINRNKIVRSVNGHWKLHLNSRFEYLNDNAMYSLK